MSHGFPTELLVHRRLSALRRALPAATQGGVDALHDARVATRRLREVLPIVIAAGGRQRGLQRRVRRITRALGPVRELDVALENLRELETSQDVPRAAIARLRQVITGERRMMQTEMRRQLALCDLEKIRKRVLTAMRRVPVVSADNRARQLVDARRRASRRAARLRLAIGHAAGIYLPDRLHDVRIAVKKLRYALEAVLELGRSRATAETRALKRAQDVLGRMHDLEVLIARTRAVQGTGSAVTLRTSADLDRLVRRLEIECRQMHGQYMALRDRLLAICDRVEHASARRRSTASAA